MPLLPKSLASLMISPTMMKLDKEVSFTRVMISLPMGGTMRLTTWSRVTWKKIWLRVMPSTCPASRWPAGTPWMPPRKISEK